MERKSLAYDPFQPIGRYCRQIINELRKTVTEIGGASPVF